MEIKNNLKRHLVGTVKGWRVAKASRYAAREEVAYGFIIRLGELVGDEEERLSRVGEGGGAYFGRVVATALEAHRQIPTCAFAGWDLALAKDGRVLLIEANLTWPEIFGAQMCCGPIFGERTDEVIDFLKRPRKQSRLFY